ncbi:MAG: MarR family transcriptional regulator [Hyphomicrobiales bacterium]|nr:MarR family transcriptional regulator [Hyphomicrobiales bacterium]
MSRSPRKTDGQARIEAVRRFNRFYTQRIGVLNQGLLRSPHPLAHARVIYELAHHGETSASELCRELDLDAGYLSRILRGLDKQGLVERRRAPEDGRRTILALSDAGQAAFAQLNARSRAQIGAMLDHLAPADRDRLAAAMATIQRLLGDDMPRRAPYLLRPHQPGDMGWVVHRHAVLYAEEWGWDNTFEALVARIAADFIDNFQPDWERCWIAEVDGAIAGSVFVVRKSLRVAQLRMLLVEPAARGLGIGHRLVDECIRFARARGYRKLTLWTNKNLAAARRIYEAAGFVLVEEEPHHSFGKDLVGQNWDLDLTAKGTAPPPGP